MLNRTLALLRTFALVAPPILLVLLAPTRVALAQTAADPSGHWEGSISAPFGEIPIAVDLARRDGQLVAAYSRGDGTISGFPLSDVELTGGELKMTLKANGGGTMRASIAGTRMTGTFAAFAGTAPFALTRTGDARLPAPLVNNAISSTLEGTWTARLSAGADAITFRMTLTNRSDGTATGTIADDNGIDIPLKFEQEGARVAIEIPTAHGTFTGTLNADATALDGTYVEGPLNTPVRFVRMK